MYKNVENSNLEKRYYFDKIQLPSLSLHALLIDAHVVVASFLLISPRGIEVLSALNVH